MQAFVAWDCCVEELTYGLYCDGLAFPGIFIYAQSI